MSIKLLANYSTPELIAIPPSSFSETCNGRTKEIPESIVRTVSRLVFAFRVRYNIKPIITQYVEIIKIASSIARFSICTTDVHIILNCIMKIAQSGLTLWFSSIGSWALIRRLEKWRNPDYSITSPSNPMEKIKLGTPGNKNKLTKIKDCSANDSCCFLFTWSRPKTMAPTTKMQKQIVYTTTACSNFELSAYRIIR